MFTSITFVIVLGILAFVIVLGVLVFVHELGHFVVAKLANVKVLEFGFGYPPRLFGIRRGETLYSLNLLPLGGFVKMVGEEDPTDPRSMASKPAWVRFLILVAGSAMNALLPLVLFTLFIGPFLTPINRADGRLSIRRAYTPAELRDVAEQALKGTRATIRQTVSPYRARQILDICYSDRE